MKQVAILYKGDKPSYPEVEDMEYTYIEAASSITGMEFDMLLVDELASVDKELFKKAVKQVKYHPSELFKEE